MHLLVISQTYVPDPAAVGQYMHEAAGEMVRRGHTVKAYASERGYDDPSRRDPKRETRNGVQIVRLPLCSFGKGSIAIRLLGGMLFCLQVIARGMWTRKVDAILVSTSPPMAPIAAIVLKAWYRLIRFGRRVPMTFWAMDINPDQMIAMGKCGQRSLIARSFDLMIRWTLRGSANVVALDRFMGQRLERKVPLGERLHIIPPWPLEGHLAPVPHAENAFRTEHGFNGKFVLMFSGNISDAHPVDTILEAAARLRDHPRLHLVFIGSPAGTAKIEGWAAANDAASVITTLPFQPLDRIRYSLSAADVHLVSMGDDMVGIVHPCKIYGAMTVARPVLVNGPADSHAGRIVEDYTCGWQIDNGDVDAAESLLRRLADGGDAIDAELAQKGAAARAAINADLSQRELSARFCAILERDATCTGESRGNAGRTE